MDDKLFVRLPAWFSNEVSPEFIILWSENGGIESISASSAYFMFIENPGSKEAYEQIMDQDNEFIGLTCIHVSWIKDSIKEGRMLPCVDYTIDKDDIETIYKDAYIESCEQYFEDQERELKRKKKEEEDLKLYTSNNNNNNNEFKILRNIRRIYTNPTSTTLADLNDNMDVLDFASTTNNNKNKYQSFYDSLSLNDYKVSILPQEIDNTNNSNSISNDYSKFNNTSNIITRSSSKQTTIDSFIIPKPQPPTINKKIYSTNDDIENKKNKNKINKIDNDDIEDNNKSNTSKTKSDSFYSNHWALDSTPPKPISSGIVKPASLSPSSTNNSKPKPPKIKSPSEIEDEELSNLFDSTTPQSETLNNIPISPIPKIAFKRSALNDKDINNQGNKDAIVILD
ncbi:hypothetical protein RB653_006131 [Dictyostelium firmibasis]|uniref:BRCT domain-containing protein n=1 Tax=Dictyostelium firmibasis TaxID=79012 RepID=A0AAN7U297_9MYCE